MVGAVDDKSLAVSSDQGNASVRTPPNAFLNIIAMDNYVSGCLAELIFCLGKRRKAEYQLMFDLCDN